MNEQLQGELLSVHENNQTYPGAPTDIAILLGLGKNGRPSAGLHNVPVHSGILNLCRAGRQVHRLPTGGGRRLDSRVAGGAAFFDSSGTPAPPAALLLELPFLVAFPELRRRPDI